MSKSGDLVGWKRTVTQKTAALDKTLSETFDQIGGVNGLACQILNEFIDNSARLIPESQSCESLNAFIEKTMRQAVRKEAGIYKTFLKNVNPSFRMPANAEYMLDKFADAFVEAAKAAVYWPLCSGSTSTVTRTAMVARLKKLKAAYCERPMVATSAPVSGGGAQADPILPPSTSPPITYSPVVDVGGSAGGSFGSGDYGDTGSSLDVHTGHGGGGGSKSSATANNDSTGRINVNIGNDLENDDRHGGGYGFGLGGVGVVPGFPGVPMVPGVPGVPGVTGGYVDPVTGMFVPVTAAPETPTPIPTVDPALVSMPPLTTLMPTAMPLPLPSIMPEAEDGGLEIFGMPVLIFCLVVVLIIAAAALAYWKLTSGSSNTPTQSRPGGGGPPDFDLNLPPPPLGGAPQGPRF